MTIKATLNFNIYAKFRIFGITLFKTKKQWKREVEFDPDAYGISANIGPGIVTITPFREKPEGDLAIGIALSIAGGGGEFWQDHIQLLDNPTVLNVPRVSWRGGYVEGSVRIDVLD